MTANKKNVIHKYSQIYEFLEQQIKDKVIKAGAQLPNEVELSKKFNVHRMTVRHAIEKLSTEYILERHRGKGTFLRSNKKNHLTRSMQNIAAFYDDIIKVGKKPRYEILQAKIIAPSEYILEQFEEENNPSFEVAYIERLMLANDEPLVLEKSYLPINLFPNILDKKLNTILYKIMYENYGIKAIHSYQKLRARLPKNAESNLLDIKENSPCISIEGKVYNDSNQIIEFFSSLYRADKYCFECSIGGYNYDS